MSWRYFEDDSIGTPCREDRTNFGHNTNNNHRIPRGSWIVSLSTSMLIILLHNTTIARSQRTTIDDWSIQFVGYRDRIDSTGSGGSSGYYYEVLHSSSTLIGCSGCPVQVLSFEYAERVCSSLTKLYPCPLHASSSGQEQEEPAALAADGYIITSPDGRYRTFRRSFISHHNFWDLH